MNIYMLYLHINVKPHIISYIQSCAWLSPSLGCYKHENNQWPRKNIKVKIDTKHMELTIGLLNNGVMKNICNSNPYCQVIKQFVLHEKKKNWGNETLEHQQIPYNNYGVHYVSLLTNSWYLITQFYLHLCTLRVINKYKYQDNDMILLCAPYSKHCNTFYFCPNFPYPKNHCIPSNYITESQSQHFCNMLRNKKELKPMISLQ